MRPAVIEDRRAEDRQRVQLDYKPSDTIRAFHEDGSQIRCIVGPMGSGKTSAAAMELFYYLPWWLYNKYGIRRTRGVVVRGTYRELMDTTLETVKYWFPFGVWRQTWHAFIVRYANGPEVYTMFRSCDRIQDMKKFKSLEVTWYWIDESVEVMLEIKNMLKSRIGRFPKQCPVRFGVETTNPPDVEDPTYNIFKWNHPPPGPSPKGQPLAKHAGFWQPEGDNKPNLRVGYYEDLARDYANSPDWVQRYIKGQPGILIRGKLVYNNYRRDYHLAKAPIKYWGGRLYLGWDDTGNRPAAAVVQVPSPFQVQILREYYSDRMNIVDFGKWVMEEVAREFPECDDIIHYGDPAGAAQFSTKEGGFTSNEELLFHECGVKIIPSDNNETARIASVESMLARINGLLLDPSCVRLEGGFAGGYVYEELLSRPGNYAEHPLKNKYSHVMDGLAYICVKLFGPAAVADEPPVIPEWARVKDLERRKSKPLGRR